MIQEQQMKTKNTNNKTNEKKAKNYLIQKLSMTIQRGNAVLWQGPQSHFLLIVSKIHCLLQYYFQQIKILFIGC